MWQSNVHREKILGSLKTLNPTPVVYMLVFALLFDEALTGRLVWVQNLLHPYLSFLRVSHSFHQIESLNTSLGWLATFLQSKSIKNHKEQFLFPNYE